MIESFSFGRIVIAGKAYNEDIIIYPNGDIQDSWWRKSGHRLVVDDIAGLIAAKPEIIIVGTGVFGYMKPDLEVERLLTEKQIRMIDQTTKKAWQTYNEMAGENILGACFHVGC